MQSFAYENPRSATFQQTQQMISWDNDSNKKQRKSANWI